MIFVYKKTKEALVLTARDMTEKRESAMAKSKSKKLPKFGSLDELVDFFDRNDTSDYWDQMPEVHFDIDIKKRTYLISLDEKVANRVTEIARSKKTSSQSLINTWIKERLSKAS